MRRAFGAAIAHDYDYYLWMNDDTRLDDGAWRVLLDTERSSARAVAEAAIVAGSTRHPATGELTYGGVVQPCLAGVRCAERAGTTGRRPRPCDTMNGNATLISRAVVQRIGNLDPAFVQQMGDFDYGLRARQAGCSVWVAPGTVGTCAPHPERRPGEQPFGRSCGVFGRGRSLPQDRGRSTAAAGRGSSGRSIGASPYVRRGFRTVLGRTPLAPPAARRARETARCDQRLEGEPGRVDPDRAGRVGPALVIARLRGASGRQRGLHGDDVAAARSGRLRAHGAGPDRRAVRAVLRPDGAGLGAGAEAGALEGGHPGGVDCRRRRRRRAATAWCGCWPRWSATCFGRRP